VLNFMNPGAPAQPPTELVMWRLSVERELTVPKILRFQGLVTDGREGMILIQKILREFRRSNGTKRAYSC